jgi:hypothetical protein
MPDTNASEPPERRTAPASDPDNVREIQPC